MDFNEPNELMPMDEAPQEQLLMTPEQEKKLVDECMNLWKLGETELVDSRSRMGQIINAYNGRHPEEIYKSKVTSKTHLCWVHKAIETAHARLVDSLLPSDQELFTATAKVASESEACDLLSKYVKYKIEKSGFATALDKAVKMTLFGESCIRCDWADGLTSTDIKFSVLPFKDVVPYPASEEPCRQVIAFRTFQDKAELEAAASISGYKNIEQLKDSDAKDFTRTSNTVYSTNTKNIVEERRRGHMVQEFYIPSIKLGEDTFTNVVATIANEKVLLRAVYNKEGYKYKPFHHMFLFYNVDPELGVVQTGKGICDKAYETEKIANGINNLRHDNLRALIHPRMKYDPQDQAFNVERTLNTPPGGYIPMSSMNSVMPYLENYNAAPIALQDIEWYKNEFEEQTGVPQFLTGAQDNTNPNETATAKRLAASGSDTRFRKIGRAINTLLVEPLIKQVYAMVTERLQWELQAGIIQQQPDGSIFAHPESIYTEIKKVCCDEKNPVIDTLLMQLPTVDAIEIKIVAFENVLKRMDTINNFERLSASMGQLAAAEGPDTIKKVEDLIDKDNSIKNYVSNLGLEENLRDTAEVTAIRQQRISMLQQQQAIQMEMMAQQQAMQMATAQGGRKW